ncbi:unnamed protein product, partial [Rotaria sp. Silwood1]
SRSIRQQDNPESYQERLNEFNSPDFQDAVNRSDAIIKNIVWKDSTDFLLPPAESEDIFSGLSNAINIKLPKYVELELFNDQTYKLEPHETGFNDMNNISMTRVQLPLAIGYAITIHRTQCMTHSKLVIDLGGKYWKPRMFYTVLSRTRHITDIIMLAYDRKSFKSATTPDDAAKHSIPDPNLSYTSNVNNTEKKNKRSRNNSKHPNKRWKVINNININDTTNVDDDTNMVDDIIKPADVIICEKQRLLFCGSYALRAIVQDRQIFDNTYLISLAEELATQELILRPCATTVRQFYFNYITDYYHIQVIQKALQQQYNIELLQLQKKDETSYLH